MPPDRDLRARLAARDRGLRRLRALTKWLVVGAAGLSAAFAGLAAHSAPGRKATRATLLRATTTRPGRVPAPPALPALGSDYSTSASTAASAPAQAPSVAASAPVVVSGGS
jgi:hypothetical protein